MPKRRRPNAQLARLHLTVLAFAYYERVGTVEDVARRLGLDPDEAERVCSELEAAGYLTWLPQG